MLDHACIAFSSSPTIRFHVEKNQKMKNKNNTPTINSPIINSSMPIPPTVALEPFLSAIDCNRINSIAN